MSRYSNNWSGWAPYVPVAERRRKAAKKIAALAKKGQLIQPVEVKGRKITSTFWGNAWNDYIESYSDFENRLPRGRTYVRNGSVVNLQITKGKIEALVSGSSLYKVNILIDPLPNSEWKAIQAACAGQISSLIELLQGKLSDNILKVITDTKRGIFPPLNKIKMSCSCPDSASLCKHLAATLYGVGTRLDHQPDLLFLLRGVDHLELIQQADAVEALVKPSRQRKNQLAPTELSTLFGIDIETKDKVPKKTKKSPKKKTRSSDSH